MKQIKTIRYKFYHSEEFDSDVNKALADGWTLTKRLVLQPTAQPHSDSTYFNNMLYAELEKDVTEVRDCISCKHADDPPSACVESQLTEDRDKLRRENATLSHDLNVLSNRLAHLLQSKTIQLFDQVDDLGNYKRDIKKLDTYGVHYKVKEYENNEKQQSPECDTLTEGDAFTEGDALMAPNHQIITFPDGNSIKVSKLDGGYYLITRDGLEMVCPDGKVLKVR